MLLIKIEKDIFNLDQDYNCGELNERERKSIVIEMEELAKEYADIKRCFYWVDSIKEKQ